MIEHIFSKQWLLKNSLYTQIVANLTDISLNTVNIIHIIFKYYMFKLHLKVLFISELCYVCSFDVDDMPALAMSQISDYFEKCPPLLTLVDKVIKET